MCWEDAEKKKGQGVVSAPKNRQCRPTANHRQCPRTRRATCPSLPVCIDEPLAPETTVPELLPTQSPAHKLLSLLENDKDFLAILFGEPSSRKSSGESKSKGSNESIKGESSADHEDEDNEEAPSRPETKILLQVKNGYQ
jgi:hypothetical protein